MIRKQVPKPEHLTVKGKYYLCECDCGNFRVHRASDIVRNKSLSCGKCSKNKFEVNSCVTTGYTTKGEPFYFDYEDMSLVEKYTWCINTQGYVVAWDRTRQRFIYLHRLVMGLIDDTDFVVDHIYHQPNDNRKECLRICTHQQNIQNSRVSKNNSSGVTGVRWSNDLQKWTASIMVDGKQIHLITSDNFNDAVSARLHAEKKYFGKYSYLQSAKKGQYYEKDESTAFN